MYAFLFHILTMTKFKISNIILNAHYTYLKVIQKNNQFFTCTCIMGGDNLLFIKIIIYIYIYIQVIVFNMCS